MPDQELRAPISGRYRLRSEIGSGGMGTVWRADDTLLQREVAIKEIALPRPLGAGESESIRKRVLREARAAAALNHQNAVTVFDVIEEDGKAFIVMEHIAGRTLEDIVKKNGPLPDDRAANIAAGVLSALESAHTVGIVHRDVKPANVMITDDGRTLLADFGIASVKDDPKITASGLILGSPSYMAPEQATHGSSGPAVDLWGLGATLYFALEGVPPFRKNGPIPTLTSVVDEDHRPLESGTHLEGLVQALLAKNPNQRPSTAEARQQLFAPTTAPPTRRVALEDARTTATAPSPAPTARPERTPPARDRRPLWWLVGIGLLLLAGIAAVMLWDARQPEERGRRDDRRAAAPAGEQDDASTNSEAAQAPAEWTTYEHDIGYTVRYPSDWTVDVQDEQNTFFNAPNGTYLQVAWRQPPSELGPEGAWEAQAETFGASHEDYEEIRIDPTTFQGMDAAEWEFTYEDGGARLHAVDLGFITTDDSTGMALLFQTHEEDWESSQELFEQLKAGFRPPA